MDSDDLKLIALTVVSGALLFVGGLMIGLSLGFIFHP